MYGKFVKSSQLWGKDSGSFIYNTYEIESELGSGGCGAVFKAWHKRLQKYIVIKELRDSCTKPVEVCRNEVEALKNIKSLYLPQVFDYLTQDDSSYTVMEYIQGESFDVLLAQGRVFNKKMIAKWYYQLASALEELHDKGVCHRDIKPGNIMLMPGGDVCLIDFNSALVNGNNTRVVSRSIGYASPEQTEYYQICESAYREKMQKQKQKNTGADPGNLGNPGSNPGSNPGNPGNQGSNPGKENKQITKPAGVDWKLSDIYSLGATMYHLYTGRRPPQTQNAGELLSRVSEASTDIEAIIGKSMQANPQKRFKSAHELCARLEDLKGKFYGSIG